MQQEHQPIHLNTFDKGADFDSEKELSCSHASTGVYIDSRNSRPVSNDGNTGSNEKIKGEQLLHQNNTGLSGYTCIGSTMVNEDLVEFWAPNSLPAPGIVRVNGVVVLKSDDFELRTDYPLQVDKNDNCIGGEVFITDNRVPPYIFNIKDMVDSLTLDPNKYFSNFDPLLYQVNLQSPLDRLVFVELVNVGGGGGLPVGQYQYQMRYVSEQGDRTNWVQATPMIPVVQALSSESDYYPWVKTYGGAPNPSSVTAYAIKLRFRVTNLYNYDYVEIKRISYNAGAGIEFAPIGKIVAKINIGQGEISVREYIDPSESNTDVALSVEDETLELVEVERAKAIRYFDKRLVLMNVKVASKEADLQMLTINDKESWPVIDKLYKEGHKDPWNHTYRKKYMAGEKYGFGIQLFDGVGTKAFVQKIQSLKNYQFPNRRDQASTETLNYSYLGTVKAATSGAGNSVGQTHEVFDLSDPRYKPNKCDFKNIVRSGRVLGLTGTKSTSTVKQDCDQDNGEIENHGANVNAGLVSVSYQPFHPVAQNDSDVSGHGYAVNTRVVSSTGDPTCATSVGDDEHFYTPTGFSPDYYSMGLMIAGVNNFPKWAKAFSVVRTDAAKRVVCQGLGFYALDQAKYKVVGNEELATKAKNKFWFFSPDIQQGIVSSDTINDIIDNPQNYALQFVSPLGFFSEAYSFEDNLLSACRDRIIDMISYVRMIRDDEDNPQINPNEDANMGVPGGDGFRYVAYDKYRNQVNLPTTFNGDAAKGNRVFSLSSVKRISEGRGNFIELNTASDVYGVNNVGGINDRDFDDTGMKDWTEPMYIINIIRTGADVRDQNIQKYRATDHYQKIESIIGRGTGLSGQKLLLVDERWEDCIPAINSTAYGASTDRFIYIKKIDGTIEKWMNVTFKTAGQVATIIANINALGAYNTDVKGVYTHNNIDNKNRFFEILFPYAGFYPPDQSLIIVKYDNTAPIRVYGGDTFVGESIFAPVDRKANSQDNAAETQFAFGIGFPFFKWKMNPRYYTIRKAGAALNVIQDKEDLQLGYLRQLCAMFTVESRAAVHYAYNGSSQNQFFPLINYIIRPNRWDEDKGLVDNGIWSDYGDDYGDEKSIWKFGGFRFLQQVNPDYSCESPKEYFSKPDFGFEEKTEFCTRVMWSLPRAINVQDSPGLKTFPANNHYDIDDDQGEIKRAWDATTERGENLYAVTNTGTCLLITKKSILSDMNGGDIGYMSADLFVSQQYWISKDVGMFDEFWRSAAEGFVPVTLENNAEIRKEAIFFANNESVFRLMDNTIMDIGRMNYHTKVYGQGISKVKPGYQTHITAVFDKYYQEYWLHIKDNSDQPDVNNTFVFGQKNNWWYGTNDFKFDRFTPSHNRLFAHRNLETFELHKGYVINGSPIVYELLTGASPEQFWDKEFIRIRINSPSGQKPTKISFYKSVGGNEQCYLDPSSGPLYLKDYRGYEQFIPRIDSSVDPSRPRFQQRLIVYKIIHNLASEFKVIDSAIQYKKIKG